nr:hypothetical protein BaRGS_011795 [Batillaria attramentaria]
MQEKTNHVAAASAQVGLNIHKGKSKILKTNAASNNPITLDGKALEEAFTYLGSVIDKQGGTDTDVKARIGKARATFIQLRNIWSSKELSVKTKVRIFNTSVKAVLLYGAETWRITVTTTKKVQQEHMLLAGSPKLDRSKGRGQTNVDHLSKRLNGFA